MPRRGKNKDGNPLFGDPTKVNTNKYTPFKVNNESVTYGVLGAQKIYLISQDSQVGQKKIDLKIPSSCHRAPFNKITVTNTKTNDVNTTVITVLADQLISEFANFDMIMSFTKNLIFSNYKNIDNYIKIANEE